MKTLEELNDIIYDFDFDEFKNPPYGFDQVGVINFNTGEIRVEFRTYSNYTPHADDDSCIEFTRIKWNEVKDIINPCLEDLEEYDYSEDEEDDYKYNCWHFLLTDKKNNFYDTLEENYNRVI